MLFIEMVVTHSTNIKYSFILGKCHHLVLNLKETIKLLFFEINTVISNKYWSTVQVVVDENNDNE